MGKVKGSILRARLAYMEAHFNEAEQQAVWSVLSESDRQTLKGNLLSGSWYSRDLFDRLMTAVNQNVGAGDFKHIRKMGYFAAGLQLTGAYDSFVRKGDPGFLVCRANSIWQIFHDFGRIESAVEPGRCRLWLKDLGRPDIATVEGIIGWTQQALEMSGCHDIRYRYLAASSAKGDAYEIRFVWRLDG